MDVRATSQRRSRLPRPGDVFTVCFVLPCVLSFSASGQFTRTADAEYTLTAYRLDPPGEASFIAGEGGRSEFWARWTDNALDSAIINTYDDSRYPNYSPPFTQDTVCLKAAYGENGVYLLWRGALRKSYVANAHFYCANVPAESLYANRAWLLPCSDDESSPHQLTRNYTRVDCPLPLGGMTQMCLSYLLPELANQPIVTCFPGPPNGGVVWYSGGLDTAAANAEFGLLFRSSRDSALRYDYGEWMIPWRSLGGPATGGVPRMAEGQELAMAFGCTGYTVHCYWRNKASPYSNDMNPQTGNYASLDCWGNMFFGSLAPTSTWDAAGRSAAKHYSHEIAQEHLQLYDMIGRALSSKKIARGVLVCVVHGEVGLRCATPSVPARLR